MKKRLLIILFFVIFIFSLGTFITNATNSHSTTNILEVNSKIDPTTNFFTQPANQEKITIVDERDSLLENSYKKIVENNYLIMYRNDQTMAIAIYDKDNGYMWYSNYKKIDELDLSDTINAKINSGVTIEFYDANSGSISTLETSITSKKANTEISYEKIDNGFVAHLNFSSYGISFDVNVSIDNKNLIVDVPYTSINEVTVGKLKPKDYQLKAIYLFPYFGSENYEINGYAFIPDGSGALIRYQNINATAAYIKNIYGNDEGILETAEDDNYHIVSESDVSLPIYGINHGYNQAAFLCEIISGDGSAEIHSYPYNYKNTPLNTTFFKLGVRDQFMVKLSSSSPMTLINEEPYPNNYSLKYSFLSNESASYVGMAKEYRNHLGLTNEISSSDIPLHLNILGLDYKEGLFGKNYIEMTSYKDTINISKDLKANNVNNMHISYLGWNKGGYFNDGAVNATAASNLGGKAGLQKLNEYLSTNNFSIDYTINPLVSDTYGFGKQTIKRINLSAFNISLKASLEQDAYYISPNVLSNTIIKKNKKYQKLGITSFNVDHLADTFSYRYKNKTYSRSQMINIVEEEVSKLVNYKISTSNPKAYLFRYLTNYYNAEYESSKFIYETDSVPFISIILSGSVNLFSSNINYISDYNLFILRMIEYNLYPSFIITKEEAYDLRFTNFEYLNSTEYALWKEVMIEVYEKVNSALKLVKGASIINHEAISNGIIKITYSNNVSIYLNYNDSPFVYNNITLEPYSFKIIGGSNE